MISPPVNSLLNINISEEDNIKKKPSLNSVKNGKVLNTPTFQNNNISYNMNKSCNSFDFSKNNSVSSHNSSEASSLMVSNQRVSDEINSACPDIILEETEGDLLEGKKVVINPKGLANSPRMYGDGFVFFGEKYENDNQEIINDITININSGNTKSINSKIIKTNEHFFVIYFHLVNQSYYIRPYTNSNISFIIIKLDSSYKVHSKEYIVLSDYIFQVSIDTDDTLIITKLPTKKSSTEAVYKYKIDYGPITIGRDKNCTISFPHNKSFSKVNTTLFYSKPKKGWIVNDGGDSPSTNGTWVMLRHSFELYDGCEFKTITNSKFKVSYSQKSIFKASSGI